MFDFDVKGYFKEVYPRIVLPSLMVITAIVCSLASKMTLEGQFIVVGMTQALATMIVYKSPDNVTGMVSLPLAAGFSYLAHTKAALMLQLFNIPSDWPLSLMHTFGTVVLFVVFIHVFTINFLGMLISGKENMNAMEKHLTRVVPVER